VQLTENSALPRFHFFRAGLSAAVPAFGRSRSFCLGGKVMQTRVAVMGIIVENTDSVEQLNHLLHEYGHYIIGRMGIPYRARSINIVSIAIDAPQDVISALSGKIGSLDGISVKTAYSNVLADE